MPTHLMYLVTIAGLVLAVWLVGRPAPAPEPTLTAGYYCTGQPDGVRVYAPGRTEQGRAVVIWADTGRLHHIDIEQLTSCEDT